MMTLRAVGEAHNAYNGTSLSVPKPAGLAAGDTMLAAIGTNDAAATITPPDGWTLVTSSSASGTMRTWVFVRVAEASEPSSYLFTSDAAVPLEGQIAAYQGTATVHASASGYQNTQSATFDLPSITTTEDDCTIVYLVATWEVPQGSPHHTVTSQSAGTLRDTHTGWWVSGAVGDMAAATAGTYSGVQMSTSPWPGFWAGVAVALLPGTTEVSVSVAPATAQVLALGTKQFAATVEGYVSDGTVTWSVVGGGAGGAVGSSGLYTAPASPGTDTVRATSNEDGTKHGDATVTVLASGTIVSTRIVARRVGL